jgi:hypothetical protein
MEISDYRKRIQQGKVESLPVLIQSKRTRKGLGADMADSFLPRQGPRVSPSMIWKCVFMPSITISTYFPPQLGVAFPLTWASIVVNKTPHRTASAEDNTTTGQQSDSKF